MVLRVGGFMGFGLDIVREGVGEDFFLFFVGDFAFLFFFFFMVFC